ncbi:MAG: DnaJ domain-containing protein [Nitrospirae bacterium]|nr:DnaJ domain-containing protein [Nitrospirota bacterium]
MTKDNNHAKAMELRKKLRDRLGDLQNRVDKSSEEAFERVFHERMDTYFAQEERLDEMALLLSQMTGEIDQADDLDELKKLAGRLNFLEDHFEEIDSQLYNRPMRRRNGRFNLFEFLRQWESGQTPGTRNEINSEAEAYQELGMDPGSSMKSITAAFRRLVKELHPDRHGGDRSTEPKLRKLVAAYEFIKKKQNDRQTFSR